MSTFTSTSSQGSTTTNPTNYVFFSWSSVSAVKRTGYAMTAQGLWYKVQDSGRKTAQIAKPLAACKVPEKYLSQVDEMTILH